MSGSVDDLRAKVASFNKARGWSDSHTPEQLAVAISVEAAELLECFLWNATADSAEERARVVDEMADVFIYLLSLSDLLRVDLGQAVRTKLEINDRRFPTGTLG